MSVSTVASPVRHTAFTKKQVLVALCAAAITFLTYASVYAYRKPFTVATFDGIKYWGVPYQILLIISQGMGYMFSKFYGIKFISELKRLGRWKTTAVLVGVAWLCLLFFAIVPAPWGMLFMFVNGFMLGFMWGIIFSYAEGRRATDFIGSVMAVSFIFAGGFTRSVAKWLMVNWNISEQWMPFMTGLVFLAPLVLFTFLLERVPQPDEDDIQERTVRLPMNRDDRKKFLKLFGLGIVAVTVTYLFLTIMRDVRDNFMANLWNELGYGKNFSIFARTETITSLIILGVMCFLVFIRKNISAFRIVHGVIIFGFLLSGISSLLFVSGSMKGALWMQLVGLGLYLAYIPFNCIFFERMIATFRIAGNVGFLIYIADAFGYLGSIVVMLTKEILQLQLNWTSFYSNGVIIFSVIGAIGTLLSLFYFNKKFHLLNQNPNA
jgi:MFS family permease